MPPPAARRSVKSPDELPPVAHATDEVLLFAERLRAVRWLIVIGIALILVGQFKPVARFFFPAFPWITLCLGGLIILWCESWVFRRSEHMKKSEEKKLAFLFGVVFVVVLLVIAILVPVPTPFQYTVFRIVLALAAGGVAAMIPGFLNVQVNQWLRAGGALAVFVIVFFYSPAALVTAAPE